MNWWIKFRQVYQKSERILVYGALSFIVVVFYFGHFLGPLRDRLLPGAIAGIFAILFKTMFSIIDIIAKKYSGEKYQDLNEVTPKILELLKRRTSNCHTIKTIGSTGATLPDGLFSYLCQDSSIHVNVILYLVDPDSPIINHMPKYWPDETRYFLNRLKTEVIKNLGSRVSLELWMFDHIPCISGYLIDDQHLFLNFYVWKQSENQEWFLKSHSEAYVYYRRSEETERYFGMFESWIDGPPCKKVTLSA